MHKARELSLAAINGALSTRAFHLSFHMPTNKTTAVYSSFHVRSADNRREWVESVPFSQINDLAPDGECDIYDELCMSDEYVPLFDEVFWLTKEKVLCFASGVIDF